MADKLVEYVLDGGYARVVWDWNGTLLDDLHHHSRAMDSLCQHFGRGALHLDDYRRAFGFPITAFYQRIGFDLESPTFAELSEVFFSHYENGLDDIALFDGAVEMLTRLAQSGVRHSILSAHHENSLRRLVRHHRIDHHFDHVFGLDNTDAHSKEERGRELVALLDEAPDRVLMIGDTDHDHEVGEVMGVDVLLVADGLQHESRLHAVHDQVLSSRYG